MKKLIKIFPISMLFMITLISLFSNNLYAQNGCGEENYQDCYSETTMDQCDISLPGNYCDITYTYCLKHENGQNFIFISNFSTDEDCPCTDLMKSKVIGKIFNSENVKSYFNIENPEEIQIFEVYVANCIRTERTYLTNGDVRITAIDCEGSGCCSHTFKVKYRWTCNATMTSLMVDYYELINTNNLNETCIEPCFANCNNFNGYVGPPMDLIETKTSKDIIVSFKDNSIEKIEFNYDLSDTKNIYQTGILRIYTSSGQLLINKNVESGFELSTFLKSLNYNYGLYLYELQISNNRYYQGKILITE